MSTIPEVLVAAHCGIRVFAFSLVTNVCIIEEDSDAKANHEEVIEAANDRKDFLMSFVSKVVKDMGTMIEEEIESGALQVTPPVLKKQGSSGNLLKKQGSRSSLRKQGSKASLLGTSVQEN